MIRQIIKIDRDLCNGCGLCVSACAEGAIGMVDGKAMLLRDDYCDGLGDCLPVCPTGAIGFEEREAAPFDEEAVKEAMRTSPDLLPHTSSGCPGQMVKTLAGADAVPRMEQNRNVSQLRQWPVQMKLAPIKAPFYHRANLLIAADCTGFAYGNFHQDFIRNHVTLIGCPKLDEGDYAQKLTEILRQNDIKSLKVVRMEVPCCGGMERAAVTALKDSGKFIPWQIVTITTDGFVKED